MYPRDASVSGMGLWHVPEDATSSQGLWVHFHSLGLGQVSAIPQPLHRAWLPIRLRRHGRRGEQEGSCRWRLNLIIFPVPCSMCSATSGTFKRELERWGMLWELPGERCS